MATEKTMKVHIEAGGDSICLTANEEDTFKAIFSNDGRLRGLETSAIRVNGAPASMSDKAKDGDRVTSVPSGGKLADSE